MAPFTPFAPRPDPATQLQVGSMLGWPMPPSAVWGVAGLTSPLLPLTVVPLPPEPPIGPPLDDEHSAFSFGAPPNCCDGSKHAFLPSFPLTPTSLGSAGPTGSVGVVPGAPSLPFPATMSVRA